MSLLHPFIEQLFAGENFEIYDKTIYPYNHHYIIRNECLVKYTDIGEKVITDGAANIIDYFRKFRKGIVHNKSNDITYSLHHFLPKDEPLTKPAERV